MFLASVGATVVRRGGVLEDCRGCDCLTELSTPFMPKNAIAVAVGLKINYSSTLRHLGEKFIVGNTLLMFPLFLPRIQLVTSSSNFSVSKTTLVDFYFTLEERQS